MMIWLHFRLRAAAALFAVPFLCAAALLFSAAPASAQAPSSSQMAPSEVSLEYFHERLTPLGNWVNHPVWGEVWQPDAGPNFRPYFYGYWDYTSDYGSLWVSNEPYGDIVYHYGRWVFDMNYGWLWVPGYVWGPSWVVWRANQDYVGWLPMPPGYLDYDQPLRSAPYASDSWYGYQTFYGPVFVSEYFYTLWIFVQNNDFGRSDRRRYVTDLRSVRDLYHGSNDRTHYVTLKDRIIDSFIDHDWLKREAHRDFEPKPAERFLHRNVPMMSVSQGREIFRHRPNVNPANGDPFVANAARVGTAGDAAPIPRSDAAAGQPNALRGGNPAAIPQFPGRSKFVRAPGVNPPAGATAGVPSTGSPAADADGNNPARPRGLPRFNRDQVGTTQPSAPATTNPGIARRFGRVVPYTDGTAGPPPTQSGFAATTAAGGSPGTGLGVATPPPVSPSAPMFGAPGRFRFASPGGGATTSVGAMPTPSVPPVSVAAPAAVPPVAIPPPPVAVPAPAPAPSGATGGAALGRHFLGGR